LPFARPFRRQMYPTSCVASRRPKALHRPARVKTCGDFLVAHRDAIGESWKQLLRKSLASSPPARPASRPNCSSCGRAHKADPEHSPPWRLACPLLVGLWHRVRGRLSPCHLGIFPRMEYCRQTASDYHCVWRIQLISPRPAGVSLQLTSMTRAVAHSSATFRKSRTFALPTM
jgi:hypothetical protein